MTCCHHSNDPMAAGPNPKWFSQTYTEWLSCGTVFVRSSSNNASPGQASDVLLVYLHRPREDLRYEALTFNAKRHNNWLRLGYLHLHTGAKHCWYGFVAGNGDPLS